MKLVAVTSCMLPAVALDISVTGGMETVWNYDTDRRSDLDACDFHPVGYRTNDGRSHLTIPHSTNSRLSGSSLDSLSSKPETTFDSEKVQSAAWGDFGYHQWVGSPYTEDGSTFYALAHSEWYACLQYASDPVKRCGVGNNRMNSWVNAITLFQSTDGGASWSPANGNNANHVVMAPSMPFPEGWHFWESTSLMHYGFFHPSNIVKQDSYYYANCYNLVRAVDTAQPTRSGFVLMRTSALGSASGWTVWSGSGWVSKPSWDAMPLIDVGNPPSASSTIFYSEVAGAYVFTFELDGQLQFLTTPSLEAPAFSGLQAVGGFSPIPGTYAIVQDPSQSGFNLERVGASGYVYGCYNKGNLRRDVVRWPIALSGGGPAPPTPSPTPSPTPPPTPSPSGGMHPIYRCADSQRRHSLWEHSNCDGVGTMEAQMGCLADDNEAGTTALYVCLSGVDYVPSTQADCEGMQMVRTLGYIWQGTSSKAPTALYRCVLPGDHFVSIESGCEGTTSEGPIGWVGQCSGTLEGEVVA